MGSRKVFECILIINQAEGPKKTKAERRSWQSRAAAEAVRQRCKTHKERRASQQQRCLAHLEAKDRLQSA